MPDKFITLDMGFPTFTGRESTEEKVNALLSYQYQLQESLRYLLRHLDSSNFDASGLASLTDPIRISMQEEFNHLDMNFDASGLELKIEGLESALELKVNSSLFQSTIETQNDKISIISQTIDVIHTTVSSQQSTIEGNSKKISTLEQTDESITASVSEIITTTEGQSRKIASLELSIDGIRLGTRSDGGTAYLQLINGDSTDEVGLALGVLDGAYGGTIISLAVGGTLIQSPEITIAGAVTFYDLETGGASVINGDNITTGTINGASFIAGGNERTHRSQILIRYEAYDDYGYPDYTEDVGGIRYAYFSGERINPGNGIRYDYGDKLYLETYSYSEGSTVYFPSIKMSSVGRISIEADSIEHGYVYIYGGGDPNLLPNDEVGVTIHAPDAPVRIQSKGDVWEFDGDGLYLNGRLML